jgi:hypothetical protein
MVEWVIHLTFIDVFQSNCKYRYIIWDHALNGTNAKMLDLKKADRFLNPTSKSPVGNVGDFYVRLKPGLLFLMLPLPQRPRSSPTSPNRAHP